MRLSRRPFSTPCCTLCRAVYTQHDSSDNFAASWETYYIFLQAPATICGGGKKPHQPSDSAFQVYCIIQVREMHWKGAKLLLMTSSLTREVEALRTKPKQPMTQQDKHLPPTQHTGAGFSVGPCVLNGHVPSPSTLKCSAHEPPGKSLTYANHIQLKRHICLLGKWYLPSARLFIHWLYRILFSDLKKTYSS